jgi:hypothetical protein
MKKLVDAIENSADLIVFKQKTSWKFQATASTPQSKSNSLTLTFTAQDTLLDTLISRLTQVPNSMLASDAISIIEETFRAYEKAKSVPILRFQHARHLFVPSTPLAVLEAFNTHLGRGEISEVFQKTSAAEFLAYMSNLADSPGKVDIFEMFPVVKKRLKQILTSTENTNDQRFSREYTSLLETISTKQNITMLRQLHEQHLPLFEKTNTSVTQVTAFSILSADPLQTKKQTSIQLENKINYFLEGLKIIGLETLLTLETAVSNSYANRLLELINLNRFTLNEDSRTIINASKISARHSLRALATVHQKLEDLHVLSLPEKSNLLNIALQQNDRPTIQKLIDSGVNPCINARDQILLHPNSKDHQKSEEPVLHLLATQNIEVLSKFIRLFPDFVELLQEPSIWRELKNQIRAVSISYEKTHSNLKIQQLCKLFEVIVENQPAFNHESSAANYLEILAQLTYFISEIPIEKFQYWLSKLNYSHDLTLEQSIMSCDNLFTSLIDEYKFINYEDTSQEKLKLHASLEQLFNQAWNQRLWISASKMRSLPSQIRVNLICRMFTELPVDELVAYLRSQSALIDIFRFCDKNDECFEVVFNALQPYLANYTQNHRISSTLGQTPLAFIFAAEQSSTRILHALEQKNYNFQKLSTNGASILFAVTPTIQDIDEVLITAKRLQLDFSAVTSTRQSLISTALLRSEDAVAAKFIAETQATTLQAEIALSAMITRIQQCNQYDMKLMSAETQAQQLETWSQILDWMNTTDFKVLSALTEITLPSGVTWDQQPICKLIANKLSSKFTHEILERSNADERPSFDRVFTTKLYAEMYVQKPEVLQTSLAEPFYHSIYQLLKQINSFFPLVPTKITASSRNPITIFEHSNLEDLLAILQVNEAAGVSTSQFTKIVDSHQLSSCTSEQISELATEAAVKLEQVREISCKHVDDSSCTDLELTSLKRFQAQFQIQEQLVKFLNEFSAAFRLGLSTQDLREFYEKDAQTSIGSKYKL